MVHPSREAPLCQIRRAELGDAQRLARLAESTFRATFGAMNSVEHMAAHCRDNYGEKLQATEIANPALLTLLCEHDGELIGFAQLRWGGAPDCVAAAQPGELQRLYVAGEWHGLGVAQTLMKAGLDAIQPGGSDLVWLGVWEHNPRAIAFYRKLGFVPVGEQLFSLGGDQQRDIVMVKPLTGLPAELAR